MQNPRQPAFLFSLFVFLSILFILLGGLLVLKADIHSLLVLCVVSTSVWAVAGGFSFDEILEGMKQSISSASSALLIFILIGTLIGSWIASGTVPALVYYGLELLNLQYFLPLGLVICSLASTATGTSWGTVGTIGLAMMGMGYSLGIPAPVTAGMVVSGAFFGDKMSPISDTTNLSAMSAEADLYEHIRNMLYTTAPAFLLSLVTYYFIGRQFVPGGEVDAGKIMEMQEVLARQFELSPWLLLPVITLFTLNLLRVPAVPAMAVGSGLGVLFTVVFQGKGFAEALAVLNDGYHHVSGHALTDKLLNRGGIQNMMWTFSLSFIALCLGGVLEKARFLEVLILKVLERIRKARTLGILTLLTSLLGNLSMGEVYLSIILNGSLYKKAFREKGLRSSMLSRYIEEGATLTGGLIPWTTAGAFISGALGVATLEYLPYTFLSLFNLGISVVLTGLGIFVFRNRES